MRHEVTIRPGSKQRSAAAVEIELIYELLDAHNDTSRLAGAVSELDPAWRAHLEYLRALQRKGREAIAQLALEMNQ